jgi:hypothetical protein
MPAFSRRQPGYFSHQPYPFKTQKAEACASALPMSLIRTWPVPPETLNRR